MTAWMSPGKSTGMSTGEGPWSVAPARRALPQVARAYCGPAHGRTWTVLPDGPPPAVVDVRLDTDSRTGGGTGADNPPQIDQTVRYRLVHHPRTRRPVRDHAGSYLYMPVRTVSVGLTPTAPIQLDVRLPVEQRVRELVMQACDEPAPQTAFGAGRSLIR